MKTETKFLMPNGYICFFGGLICGTTLYALLYFVGVKYFGWSLQVLLGPISDKQIPFSAFIYIVLYILFFWGILTIVYKNSLLNYELHAFVDLEEHFQSATIISKRAELDNLKAAITHGTKGANIRDSALVQTLLFLIDHCLVTETSSRVMEIFSRRMDTLDKHIDSSYSILRYIAAAIPSLGFIGTVLGIGYALNNASLALEDMSLVTGPLGMAFDTTLIALTESVILMFFIYSMQHREESLLNKIDLFCQEKFIINLRLE